MTYVWLVPLVLIGAFALAGVVIYAIETDWHRARFEAYGFQFDSYRTDKSTGFPVVPEGWKWMVDLRDGGTSYEKLVISLVDANGWTKGREDFYTDIDKWHKMALKIKSNKILRRLQSEHVERKSATRYVGTYPPRSLND
jgi:hypothetical protein